METLSYFLIFLSFILVIFLHMGMALICKGILEDTEWYDKKYNKFLLIPGIPQIGFVIVLVSIVFIGFSMMYSEFFDE